MAPRETENNAYAKFWDDKEYYGMLWHFLAWSIQGYPRQSCFWIPRSSDVQIPETGCCVPFQLNLDSGCQSFSKSRIP